MLKLQCDTSTISVQAKEMKRETVKGAEMVPDIFYLTQGKIAFIESMVRPKELDNEK